MDHTFIENTEAALASIRLVMKKHPELTVYGTISDSAELSKAELLNPRNVPKFTAAVNYIQWLIKEHWSKPVKDRELAHATETHTGIKKIPKGIVLAAAVHMGCKLETIEETSARGTYFEITPPANGGV